MFAFNKILKKVSYLSAIALFLCVASPMWADEEPDMVRNAHAELQQAAATAGSEREGHLKAAQEIIKHLPPPDGRGERKNRRRADGFIKSALFELKNGDPDNKVSDLIKDADECLRTAE